MKRLFVTVGTTKFNELIDIILSTEIIDQLIELKIEKCVLQVGQDYKINDLKQKIKYNNVDFNNSNDVTLKNHKNQEINICFETYIEDFHKQIEKSDLIISHAGAGTCLDVLHHNKMLVVVVNENLMDNHQTELAEQLQMEEYAYFCVCKDLRQTLSNLGPRKKYPIADKQLFSKYLDKSMGFV